MEAEQSMWVEALARRIEAVNLSPVALPFLDLIPALGFLGSQVLVMVRPLTTGIVDDTSFEHAMALFEDPELIEQLRSHLEGREG